MDWFVEMLAKFLAVTLVLTLHEFAHAFVAYKCGDPTAKWAGRMTLNPAKHFDPLGACVFRVRRLRLGKTGADKRSEFQKIRKRLFLDVRGGRHRQLSVGVYLLSADGSCRQIYGFGRTADVRA